MPKRPGVVLVMAGVLAVAAAYASAFASGGPPPWAPWAMVTGTALQCVGFMALGAARPGRGIGPLMFPLGFTFVVLVAGFGVALGLPGGEGAAEGLWAGLPVRAAVVLYGVGLLPVLVLPLAYALTFRELTLDAAALERIRAARDSSDAQRPGAA